MPTVLIIDDEPFVREVTAMSFTSAGGWDVHAVASGAAGIQRASELAPDVILLDFVMPELDGPATLTRLRSTPATAGIPVVFLTADELLARRVSADRMLGVVGVIAKPFDPMTLPDEVAAWIDPASPASRTPHPSDPAEDPLAAALAQLWMDRKPETIAQLAELRAVLEAADRAEARTRTHNLVGVLGSLGLLQSSAQLRDIDRVLRRAPNERLTTTELRDVIAALEQVKRLLATEVPTL